MTNGFYRPKRRLRKENSSNIDSNSSGSIRSRNLKRVTSINSVTRKLNGG